MAILTEIPGIQVIVKVDGMDAIEYPSPDPQHRQAICPVSCVYIESVDDAQFAVELVVDESYDFARDEEHHLLIRVEIDGGRCGMTGCEIKKEKVAASPGGSRECLYSARERRGAHIFMQKFRFAMMRKAANDQQSDNLPKDPTTNFQTELGIIRVHVYRIVQRKPVGIWSGPTIADCARIVAAARRGEDASRLQREAEERAAQRKTDFVRGDFGPFATYRFLYRPKGILEEALAKIPPTPPPPPAIAVSQNTKESPARERFQQRQAQHGARTARHRVPPRWLGNGAHPPGAMADPSPFWRRMQRQG